MSFVTKAFAKPAGILVALAALATPAQAASKMPILGITTQPIGHTQFCRQVPEECSVRSRHVQAPVLTRSRWADLVKVNNHANLSVTPVTDNDYYGVEEHWTYPTSYGDCEDYVLLKRHMLMQRGWPASSLLITVVRQPNGDGHAVLTVRTQRADFVLDNLNMKIRKWNDTPYHYVKRQSQFHSGRWTKIADNRGKLARN